ncbi:MAG: hypothetical protein HZB33_10640 [Nitrospirae bacterium]|nr:hypothetical protein [Nitrospirota bacterium]
MNRYLIAIASILILGLSVITVSAETETDAPAADDAYIFPSLPPEASFSAGYRYVDINGSARADEYEYLRNSLYLGGEYRLFRFPHRIHIDMTMKNIKDYLGDVTYSYEDTVVFRGQARGLYHNLDNVTLLDLDAATASPGVDRRDAGLDYGVRWNMYNVFLRFKTRDFPFHVYIDDTYIVRNGTQQQRFLLGSGSNNPGVIRTSRSRDIDWKTQNIVFGLNSHLGPVELDLSHVEKRFDSGGAGVFLDTYTAATGTPARAAGMYPHNLIPDSKGSGNTLKLHTAYTGGLVASMTLSKYDRENQYNGAKAEYLHGAGEIVWTMRPDLQAYLKYRHKEISIDNPGSVTMTDLLDPANAYTYSVEHSIGSITDTVSAGLKYRPVKGLSLRAEYTYDDIKRDYADVIRLPEGTIKHNISLNSDIRVVKGLAVNARYSHKEISDPAYNVEPDRVDEGRVSVTWVPLPVLSAMVSYGTANERRNDIHWLETNGSLTHGDKRDVRRDRLIGSVTLSAIKNVVITGSYAFMKNKIEQDLEYHNASGTPQVYPAVEYKNTARNYSMDINYTPVPQVSLSGGISHCISDGAFNPTDSVLTQPVSIASFSDMKVRETVITANGEYRFKGGFAAGIQYRHSDFKDVIDNPHDDVNSGKAHIVLLTFSKKW